MKSQETPTGTYVSYLDKTQMIVHHQRDPSPQSSEISNNLELHIHHHLTTSPPLQMWQSAVLTTGELQACCGGKGEGDISLPLLCPPKQLTSYLA